MRNIVFAIVMSFMTITFFSCDSNKKRLREIIARDNKNCPMYMDMIGEVSSLHYDEDNDEVVMTIIVGEDNPVDISVLKRHKDLYKKAIMGSWADKDGDEQMKEIADAGSKMVVALKSEKSNDVVRIIMSNENVRALADGRIKPLSPKESLAINAKLVNIQCPLPIDDEAAISSVSFKEGCFIYCISVDEKYVSLDEYVEQHKVETMANLKELSTDERTKKMLDVYREAKAILVYKYVGTVSGKTRVVRLKLF